MSNKQETYSILRPAPHLIPWLKFTSGIGSPGSHEEDIYVTNTKLVLNKDYPSIPPPWHHAVVEERAVWIHSIPAQWTPGAVVKLFSAWRKCVASPTIISLEGQSTFRWVVMETVEGADYVMEKMHGILLNKHTRAQLLVAVPFQSPYTSSDISKEVYEFYESIKGQDGGDQNEERAADAPTHAHPAPAAEASSSGSASLIVQKPAEVVKGKKVPSAVAADFKRKSMQSSVGSIAQAVADFKITPAVPAVTVIPAGQRTVSGGGVRKDSSSSVADPSNAAKPTAKDSKQPAEPAAAPFVPAVVSWANIATAAVPKNSIIDLKPTSRNTSGPRLHPVGRIPSVGRASEPMVEQMRTVFLMNLPNSLTLQDISDAIQEGPVLKIQFGHSTDDGQRYAGVIFQYAKDAEKFYQVLCKERVDRKPYRFRFIVDCGRGEEPYPADDLIRAMGPPTFASRRLTIVKAAFFDMFGYRQIKAFCDRFAGEEHVQLIWLYNIGNATIVFSDVESAITAKTELDRRAEVAGKNGSEVSAMWKGVQTTFSKDPCVIPLELKTAMPSFD